MAFFSLLFHSEEVRPTCTPVFRSDILRLVLPASTWTRSLKRRFTSNVEAEAYFSKGRVYHFSNFNVTDYRIFIPLQFSWVISSKTWNINLIPDGCNTLRFKTFTVHMTMLLVPREFYHNHKCTNARMLKKCTYLGVRTIA